MISASAYAANIRNLIIELTRNGLIQSQAHQLIAQIPPGNLSGRLVTPDAGLQYYDGAITCTSSGVCPISQPCP